MLQNGYAQTMQMVLQCTGNISGVIRNREYALSALHFQRNTDSFKKSHGILRGESGKCTVKKTSVGQCILNQCLRLAVIGDVTAALSGDIYFNT